jgi:hypothetical protein
MYYTPGSITLLSNEALCVPAMRRQLACLTKYSLLIA